MHYISELAAPSPLPGSGAPTGRRSSGHKPLNSISSRTTTGVSSLTFSTAPNRWCTSEEWLKPHIFILLTLPIHVYIYIYVSQPVHRVKTQRFETLPWSSGGGQDNKHRDTSYREENTHSNGLCPALKLPFCLTCCRHFFHKLKSGLTKPRRLGAGAGRRTVQGTTMAQICSDGFK